jgi:hypothetical protein
VDDYSQSASFITRLAESIREEREEKKVKVTLRTDGVALVVCFCGFFVSCGFYVDFGFLLGVKMRGDDGHVWILTVLYVV